MKKGKKILIILTLSSTMLVSSACEHIKNFSDTVNNIYNEFMQLDNIMLKTNNGELVKADTSSDIAVVVKTLATEEEKQEIINAINEINKMSPNIDYVFVEDASFGYQNYIEIYTGQQLPYDNAYGMFYNAINHETASFKYPLRIDIDQDAQILTSDQKPLFAQTIKHELMHTLGFKDLESEIYYGKSIMSYHGVTYRYTSFDKQNIATVYGTEEKEDQPTTTKKLPYKKQEEYEM